ncbi:hypothetical protein [Corynebacterium yudongzhengii]|nr:hypothetical protein [Corynebacterium yudongzhengii]
MVIDSTVLDQPRYIVGGQSRELKVEIPAEKLAAIATIDFEGLYG